MTNQVDLLKEVMLFKAAEHLALIDQTADNQDMWAFYDEWFDVLLLKLVAANNQLKFEDPRVVSDAVSRIVNIMGDSRMRAVAENLAREHRTIQQAVMRLFVMFCEEVVKGGCDLRNQAAHDLAKKILKDDPHLPTV